MFDIAFMLNPTYPPLTPPAPSSPHLICYVKLQNIRSSFFSRPENVNQLVRNWQIYSLTLPMLPISPKGRLFSFAHFAYTNGWYCHCNRKRSMFKHTFRNISNEIQSVEQFFFSFVAAAVVVMHIQFYEVYQVKWIMELNCDALCLSFFFSCLFFIKTLTNNIVSEHFVSIETNWRNFHSKLLKG